MSVELAVQALREGKPVVLPTDTVYGLACSPETEAAVRALYALKGREEAKPTALVAADLDTLLEWVPELRGRAALIAKALLPGPYTLILPNPGRRFRWLNGASPDAIGVRVPAFEGPGAEVLRAVGAVAATSANLAGAPDPRRVEDLAPAIRDGAAAVVDGGELPGTASTVIDCTAREPVVLREGAVPSAEAIARAAAALR